MRREASHDRLFGCIHVYNSLKSVKRCKRERDHCAPKKLTLHYRQAEPRQPRRLLRVIAMGILRIRGKIELEQFWPDGESDADTTKVHVIVGSDSFEYAEDGKRFKVTHVFDDAKVVGKSKEPVIKHDRVTVRLQGIDAPELHYRAAPLPRSNGISAEDRDRFNALNKTPRRQYWGETATMALHDKLAGYNSEIVDCEVLSRVDHPYELVDTYGRVVANIRVGASRGTDINIWLAEEGWVTPAFYSSMTAEEISAVLAAARKGEAKERVPSSLTRDTSAFDDKLVYRRHGAPAPDRDAGPTLMPKVFRRQVAYELQKKAGVFAGTFASFLGKSPDDCYLLRDFLEMTIHSAPVRRLHEFIDGSTLKIAPQDVVFREKFSSVVGPDGKRLDSF
jgi:endonuclease YncB( thermonuclease family)